MIYQVSCPNCNVTKTKTIDRVQDTYVILCIHCGHKFFSDMESYIPSFMSGRINSIQDTIERLEDSANSWTRMDIIRKYVLKNMDKPMLIHLFREMALDRNIIEANFLVENERNVIFKLNVGDHTSSKYTYEYIDSEKEIV